MAASRLDYQNLFGSSDEESDGDEGEQQQQSTSTAAPKASSGSCTIKPSALGKSSDDSSSDEDSSEEDEHLSAKKRLQQKGVPLASSSDEESDNEEEGDVPRPAGKARTTGSEALRRATADFDDEEEEEEPRRPNVLPDLSSDGNSSSSGSESESSDDEGDSRRRKRGAEKRKHRLKTKGKRPSKGVVKGRDGRGKAGKQVRDRGQGADEDGGAAAGTGAASEPRRAARELTAVEQALASFKRNRIQKLPDAQVQEMTQHLITLMETAAKEDRQALLQHRPATQKLKRLTEVLDLLRSKHLQGALVDNGQVLGLIRLWLQPLPDKSLPLYAVRTPMIDYLVTARVEVHRLKESGIGRVIQQLKKHPEETVENKAKLTEIVDNWSRLITGKGTTLKSRTSEEEMEGRQGPAEREGGEGGFIMSTTSRGVVIPIRTGFNFKKVALTFREEFDRGQGKEDEAMEVAEREPRDGSESRTNRVRKALKDMGRAGGKKLRHESVQHGN